MSVRILAFNTVTELCSVALMIDQIVYTDCILSTNLHAENILFMIHKLLINSGVNLKSIDCIVFDRGPGKFMGIRLGISIAQGLALGADLPLIAVSSLEVLAQGAWRMYNAKYVISIIEACKNKFFWAHYFRSVNKENNNCWSCVSDTQYITVDFAKKILYKLQGKWVLVGTGWNTNKEFTLYINNKKNNTVILKKIMLPDSKDMLTLALKAYNQKNFVELDQIQPLYLNFDIAQKSIIKNIF